jgi:glyoxylase-like metal-dependent hydrolase (beta-lactamase superfamily II)
LVPRLAKPPLGLNQDRPDESGLDEFVPWPFFGQSPQELSMKTYTFFIAAIVIAAAQISFAQQDFSKVEITATKVSGNVYMLQGAGGNIGVSVGADGILIVDDQFAPLADKIKAALKSLGDGKLKFILNTHWHSDHTDGNKVFGPEAPIVAQTNVRKRLKQGSTAPFKQDPAPKEALPVITFDQSVSIHFNGEEIRVIHFPHGHTDGDAVIFFTAANVVHMGDDFFNGMFPFVDLDSGGDVDGYVTNVGQVLARLPAGAKIIPGHGPLATAEDLKRYQRMLLETTGIVKRKIVAKKSLAQIKKEGLPDEWKSWGSGFIKTDAWIETLYRSFTQK